MKKHRASVGGARTIGGGVRFGWQVGELFQCRLLLVHMSRVIPMRLRLHCVRVLVPKRAPLCGRRGRATRA